jgi:chemotaxis protein CheX
MTDQLTSNDMLVEIIESVWAAVLGLPISTSAEPNFRQSPRALSASVNIVGGWNGAVLYLPTEAFARRCAAIMFNVAPEAVTRDDIHDAAAELCNMLAGGLKSILPGPSSLSLPLVAEGADYVVRIRRSRQLLRLPFTCDGETLECIVLEAEPTTT